jgi:hypothetical protein
MSFQDDGYVVIKNVLTKEEVTSFRNRLDKYLENSVSLRRDRSKLVPGWAGNTPELGEDLNNLHQDKRILTSLENIFNGKEFRYVSHSDLHQNKTSGWHRDHNDLLRGKCSLSSTWDKDCFIVKACFLLQDHNDNKFGLWMQPGTHLSDTQATGVHIDSNETDLIIFDQRILHKGQVSKPDYVDIYKKNRYLLTFGYGLNNKYSDLHEAGATLRQNQQRGEMK